MAKFNSEFNYRYQVVGETVWEKIKTLQGFMDGRRRAAALEEVYELKTKAMHEKLKFLNKTNAPLHEILELEAQIIESTSADQELKKNFQDNRDEIKILEKLLLELYALAEPTRLKHEDGALYTDEEMFEVNAVNEFTVLLAREIQSEIIATGHPSASKIKSAMSNPVTWQALKQIGIINPSIMYIAGNVDPSKVELIPVDHPKIVITNKDIEQLTQIQNAESYIQKKPVVFE